MLALDHIVLAGENIEESSTKYGRKFAIKAIKGGEHEEWGTYNYLAYFSNESYIEWLGIQDYEKANTSNNPLIQHLVHNLDKQIVGPFQFALRTNEMDHYIDHFNAKNIPFKGPFFGQRERPDGTNLTWRMLFPSYDYTREMLPFLIEWGSSIGSKGPSVDSLSNPQAIMKINYGGIDREKFEHIYQLKPKRLLKKQFALQNSTIIFNEKNNFTFDLV
ncbi:Glyoxalase-like domain-containing protein [Oceanobacillus limi]|uniref:Glyoxalase-like domain-containing protein n=1 Tax=Oceanobacillus limi TaxID=930131 RepID=A0A1I0AR79_9BACI|nr:VOC family protein [Oceanobacillus limi]SES96840.1 Glyoxalase-like domain-containing protein [Oceanobacillus limi]